MKNILSIIAAVTLVLLSGSTRANPTSIYETGKNITQKGDVCIETTTELVALNTIKVHNHELALPHVVTTTKEIKCSNRKNLAIRVRVTNNNKPVSDTQIITMDGEPSLISIINEKTYATKIEDNSITPVVLKTGINATVMPIVQADKHIKVDVSISIDDLEGMDTTLISERTELPPIHNSNMRQLLLLDQNKPVTQLLGNYTIEITAYALQPV